MLESRLNHPRAHRFPDSEPAAFAVLAERAARVSGFCEQVTVRQPRLIRRGSRVASSQLPLMGRVEALPEHTTCPKGLAHAKWPSTSKAVSVSPSGPVIVRPSPSIAIR